MNRNTNAHFSETPTVGIARSKFDRSFTHKTTFNAGELVPVFFDATVQPGDTIKMDMGEIVRMMTPITPVMDNANLDVYFFFVPYRLIWEHLKEFFGENDTAPWTQQIQYQIPQISAPTGGWTKGSLADHFGWPTKKDNYKASALGFRAYAKIVNDWFRDQNLKNPLYIHEGDADIAGVDILDANLDPITDIEKGACCYKIAKTHDYFTSALPQPQKGPAVNLPLGNSAPIIFADATPYNSSYPVATTVIGKKVAAIHDSTQDANLYVDQASPALVPAMKSVGLVADLSEAVGSTVNALRQAFAVQRYYEKQALYGTRYIEWVRGHFQVQNPDFRLQRSEYLGGFRQPININQVVQTDASGERLHVEYESGSTTPTWSMKDQTPQGNTAAYSLTSGRNEGLFTHSFTEHGIVIGLAAVRLASHTYQQGLNAMWSMKDTFDFYVPEFANLGNLPIKNKEIYLQGSNVVDTDGKIIDEQVFGYQEAWAHYRYFPDIVTGEMRSNYDQSLDIWHWADYYNSLPQLGETWIDEDKANFERTIAVQEHDQFMGDFYFKCLYTRAMPLYSVPGLIDHH